jgi:hypothetical protein
LNQSCFVHGCIVQLLDASYDVTPRNKTYILNIKYLRKIHKIHTKKPRYIKYKRVWE